MNIKFKYYKPKNSSLISDVIETDYIVSKQTIYTEQIRKHAKRNVPIMAKIYPETFIMLARKETELKISGLVKVALYLTMKLTEQNILEIQVKAKEIEEDLALSDKTVTKALEFLEHENLITLLSRGKYRISPRLGFYGYPIPWGIALENEQESLDKIYSLISDFNKQANEVKVEHFNKTKV